MYYQKINFEGWFIEFHNNWLGEETIIVNGQVVSKKSSVWGTNHYFKLMEKGHPVNFILTTKVTSGMQVLLDLHKNGVLVRQNVPVLYGSYPKKKQNTLKEKGLKKLNEYDLDEALQLLDQAIAQEAQDPELYFYKACIFSIQEKIEEGFEALRKAVELNLMDMESILNHDMLAYLRMHPAFEDFFKSGYAEYDIEVLRTAEVIRLIKEEED